MTSGSPQLRNREIFSCVDDSCTPEMLQQCCVFIVALAFETEAALLNEVPPQKQDDVQAILQNLRRLCAEGIRLVRAVRHRHEEEVHQRGLVDDIVQDEVDAILYRDLCGMLPVGL